MKYLKNALLLLSLISFQSYAQTEVVEEAIGEMTFEKWEMSADHLHLRGKVLAMIKDSRFDELLEIFNQKDFGSSGKIVYETRSANWVNNIETSEEFLLFLKEIQSTLPKKIKLTPTDIKEESYPWGDYSIVELYEYINTKGEKMELFVKFFNGQINIIGCRFYLKGSFL
jgi:hypothetical protein